MYEKDYDDEFILASYNYKQEIESVIVQDKVKQRVVELKTVGDNQLATIDNNEHVNNTINFGNQKNTDSPGLRNMFQIISTVANLIPARTKNDPQIINENFTHECTQYDIIDLAIVYDTSYCNAVGGRENAETEITAIITLSSKMYQQNGLCMKIEISYLEGYCEIENDPYDVIRKQNLDSLGLLQEFRAYWNQNREDVNRTVAHLFTATGIDDRYRGKGYTSSICMKASAYSVNQITWSPSLQRKAALVAHELGHNVGADHTDDDMFKCGNRAGDFIMNEFVQFGIAGFQAISVQSMRGVANSRTCMRKESI